MIWVLIMSTALVDRKIGDANYSDLNMSAHHSLKECNDAKKAISANDLIIQNNTVYKLTYHCEQKGTK